MMKLKRNVRQTIKTYKTYRDDTLTSDKCFKPLTVGQKRAKGRNNQGHITCRHKGGGAKRALRVISFNRRDVESIVGTVKTIEYDPNRTSFICLIEYNVTPGTNIQKLPEEVHCDGKKIYQYILHPIGLKVGDHVLSSKDEIKDISPGSATQLKHIPQGFKIHGIEIKPNAGAKLARSAGTFATLVDHLPQEQKALVTLRSGFMLKLPDTCFATVGTVSNEVHKNRIMYKAGQSRQRGVRPTVRGVAMNPHDHPHGGGEGRSGTKRHPVSFNAKLTKGKKTVSSKRNSHIILSRKKKK